MRNTLDLVGDGDDLDVIYDVERTFGIKMTDAQAESIRSVGDLHDLIEMKLSEVKTRACLSQVAFYRLRKSLKAMGISEEITPQTPVCVVSKIEPRSIVRAWNWLAQTAGIDLPILEVPGDRWFSTKNRYRIGGLLAALFAFLIFYLAKAAQTLTGLSDGWALIFTAVAACTTAALLGYLRYVIFRTIPQRIQTIGDLAREAAGHSFEKLAAAKNGSSSHDRWFALSALLRGVSGHKYPITRDTTFFAEQTKSSS